MPRRYSMCSKCGSKTYGVWCAFCVENMKRAEAGKPLKLRGLARAKAQRAKRKAKRLALAGGGN